MNRQKRNVCRFFGEVFCWSNTIVSMRVYLVKVSLGGEVLTTVELTISKAARSSGSFGIQT